MQTERLYVPPPVDDTTRRCLDRQPRFIPPDKNSNRKKQLKCNRKKCGRYFDREIMVVIYRGKAKKQKYYLCPWCNEDMVRKPRRV